MIITHSESQELALQLQSIQNKKQFNTLVDVGSHFYVQGHVYVII